MKNFESKFISANGVTVSYTEDGKPDNPNLIFIHGFPFNKSMWTLQAKALKNKFHVITYDVRGHGKSDHGNEEFSIELFARDLISLMDALNIDKAIVCGLSMGGYISLNAVSNFPDRFNALVLCDTQCSADTADAKEKRMTAIGNIKSEGVEKYAEGSLKNFFTADSFIYRKDDIAAIRKMIIDTPVQSLCDTLLALANRKETCSNLPEFKLPVLVLVGKEDVITPASTALMMHEKIKNSSLQIIENAGHLSNIENPLKFNYDLTEFLSSGF